MFIIKRPANALGRVFRVDYLESIAFLLLYLAGATALGFWVQIWLGMG